MKIRFCLSIFTIVFCCNLIAQTSQTAGHEIICYGADTSHLCDNMGLLCLNDTLPLPVSANAPPVGNRQLHQDPKWCNNVQDRPPKQNPFLYF